MNNYAISSAGVGEALLRSAAAMQAANNTLDETIGLATAANTILQNPQSVGTMLKTVSMYVRAAKTELEAAGEETDGIAESTGKLRELVKQITKEGGKAVDIMADENTFKSTYQIMKEISEVWDNISDANQAALLEKLGGKRNANAIAAMLENFEIAEQAMQSAAEASGSAMNELEKFQQSIQGHIVAFKTAYQELAQTLIDGELVKWAIDFGTWMVNLITRVIEFTDKLGGLSSVLAVVANILIIKDKEAILGFLADAYGGLKKVVSVIGNLGTIIPQLISGLNMGSVAFVGITAAITAGIVAFNAYQKRMQELRQDIAQTATEASRHGDDLISLYRQYDELSEKVKTDESAKDDLLTVTDRLIESLGIEETQVNNLAQKYRNLSDAIKQATADSLRDDRRDLRLEYNEREKELLGAAEDAYLVDVLGTLSNSDKAAIKAFESSGLITGTNGKLNPFEEGFSFDFDPRTTDGALKAYETYKSMIDILDSLDIKEGALYKAVTKQYTNLKSKVESYNEITQQLNDNLVNTAYIESVIGKANVETKDDFDKLRDSIVDTINATGNYAGNIEAVENAVDDFLKEDSLYAKFYGDFSRTSVEEIESLKREQEEYNAKLRDQINVINELARVKNDAAQAGFNPGETVFGNIDTNNRQVLEWTESNVDRFRSALESWGYALEDIEEMKGDISTVLGGSDWFGDDDGVEIAYSPILQTEDGPVLLSRRTVMEYIWALFDNAGGKWDASKILELDTQGLEFDGMQIKNLIASIGDDAVRVGEVMHFAGKDGAYAQAMSDAEAAASDLGVSVSDLEANLVDLHKELADGKRKLEEYNAQAEKLNSNPSAPTSNPFTSINTFNEKIGVLRAAMEEFNSGGLITNETLLKLNSTFGDENKLVEILNGKLVINTDEVDKLVTSLRDQYGMEAAVAGATADQIAQMDALASSMMSVKEATEDPIASMNELSKVLKDMQNGIEMGTSDTLSLVNKYPQLRDKIIKTANGYKIEESAIRDLIRAKSDLLTLNAREIGLESSRSSLVSSNKSGLNQANAIDRIFANFESENGRNIKSMKEFLNAYQKEFGHAFAADTDSESGGGLGGFVGDYKAYTDYIKKKIEFYKNSLEDAAVVDTFVEDYLSESGVLEGYDPNKKESSSSSTTTTKEETQFEKDYKAHQHALAMDRETTAQYLAWLEGAYKASYAKNEMELDDYYKYEEEVYEGRKQLFQTSLDEMQHQIDLLEHSTGDTYDKQAGIYMQMQKAVHDQAEMYRARGVKENSEMIRELQDQWWTYEEAIRQLREQSFNDWLNDQKFTIDLQKKNNESTDAILQSWKTVLGSLNDELKYYLSVGYDSTSDVVQNIMGEIDSAKEEMIAALEEVVSKANDVVDGFQNAYTTLTSAASEYASTGYLSVDSLQSILELGPKYLDMLYDEGGQLVINEDRLQRVIEARTNELAAETALSYAKQILLATENGEVDKLRDLADVQATSSNATWDMAYATLGYAKALGATKGIEESYYDDAINHLTKMQSLTHTATSSIAAYYKTLDQGYVSQADGLDTILKLTEDMIKQENDDKIDALEKEKDIYKDIIDEKKELLRIAKEQADHDRDQADKLKEIAELQSRIDQLALDDSREAAAQRSQLEAELLEKQKALADEQGDYAYDAQVDALDKQYDAFEKEKEDETKALKEELDSAEKLYQAAIARINNGWDTLYQDLLDWNYNYGLMLAPLYGNV